MEEAIKHYTNDDVTVVWRPGNCIHSTLCWKGLTSVFDPKKRPWVTIAGSDTDSIIAQVEKCTSGALSYFRNEESKEAGDKVTVDTIVEVMKSGPLLVYGNVTIKGKDGSETKKNKVTALCRCGASSNKPYCDGSHV